MRDIWCAINGELTIFKTKSIKAASDDAAFRQLKLSGLQKSAYWGASSVT